MRHILTGSIGAALLALCLAVPARGAGEADVNRSVKADPHGSVIISNVSGSVQVEGWDRPQVSVTGRLEAGVERLDVLSDGSRTQVTVVLPHVSLRATAAYLVVHVPASGSLEVATVSADIKVQEVTGNQRLKSVSGNITAPASGGELELKTLSGDVLLTGSGQPAKVRAGTVSGNLLLVHGAGALEITTVSGNVTAELRPLASLRARSTSGDIKLRGQLARDAQVDVETVSGDLRVDAGSDAGIALDGESFSGDISSCFGAKPEKSRYGPGERLSITRGAGGARLRLKSLSGDISICDR